MIESKYKLVLWNRFKEFIDLKTSRFALLESVLKECSLEYKLLRVAGNCHFFISPVRADDSFRRKPVLLVAHYDRAGDSPGANDNSAGVFMLIEAAANLKAQSESNWAVILTDKEELKAGESIRKQGAYSLAWNLREMNLENSRIFNFDACGTGDTIVISNTAEHFLKGESSERISSSIHELQETALKTAHNLGTVKYILMSTPFSDDAGFLRAGLAAQTITMLPTHECNSLATAIRKRPHLADMLISSKDQDFFDRNLIPQTWRNMNGSDDTYEKLTPENFRTVIRFAEALGKL